MCSGTQLLAPPGAHALDAHLQPHTVAACGLVVVYDFGFLPIPGHLRAAMVMRESDDDGVTQ